MTLFVGCLNLRLPDLLFAAVHVWSNLYFVCVKLLVQHSNIYMDGHTYDQSVGLDRMTKMTVLGNNACSLHRAGP